MNVDYIVVGSSLAGISFCEQLRHHNQSFIVFDNGSQQSSTVAGGLYNPVVLKRFTPVWKSKEQLQLVKPFYDNLEKLLKVKLDYRLPVYRKFTSLEEQNNWFSASDKPALEPYLSTSIIKNTNKNINAPFGYGEVLGTGRIDTNIMIQAYQEFLNEYFIQESFSYDDLRIGNKVVQYNDINANHIIFTEGFGIKQNPFFNDLPLKGTKGELLIIHAPQLKLDVVLKSNVFLIPLDNDHYIVGATYEWEDKTNLPTEKGKQELLEKLHGLINCPFEVVKQVAGIRPTVIDRRPLVGRHPKHNNLYVLNGLGTRGVMIAPYVAKQLYEFIENHEPLDREIDITRFY